MLILCDEILFVYFMKWNSFYLYTLLYIIIMFLNASNIRYKRENFDVCYSTRKNGQIWKKKNTDIGSL